MALIRRIAFAAIAFVMSGIVDAGEPTRIDAATSASAEASWDRMVTETSEETRSKLRIALYQLNAVAANASGLRGIAYHSALQDPSVVRVKDKVAGLTAEQIIELANQTSSTR